MGLGRDLIGGGKGITPKKNDNANKEIKEEAEKVFLNNEGGNHPNVSMSGSEIIRSSGAIMFFIGIALGFFLGLQFLAIAILGIILFIIAPYIHMPSGEALITIFIIGGVVLIGVVWFFGVGGGQATAGMGNRVGESFSGLFNNYLFRSIGNMLKNPFGIGVTGGKYEEQEQKTKAPPNQAFSISIRGNVNTAKMNQHSLTFIVTIKNLGSSKINELHLRLDSLSPYDNCLKFNNEINYLPNGKVDDTHQGTYGRDKVIYNLAPFSTREVVFSGGWIDLSEVKKVVIDKVLKANTNTPIYIRATAWTYYPTASRLAVERIKSDFGVLLIKNNALRQKSTGAIYKYGSAMTIDMDIGPQPILDNSNSAALLLKWQNVGNGNMKSNMSPMLFIVTPKDFGKCIPAGYIAYKDAGNLQCDKTKDSAAGCIVCDSDLVNSWCDKNSKVWGSISEYMPDIIPTLTWACDMAKTGDKHVCGTTDLTMEFNVFTCSLNVPKISTTEDIITDYITTIATYPYEVNSQTVKVNTFCTSDQTGCGG